MRKTPPHVHLSWSYSSLGRVPQCKTGPLGTNMLVLVLLTVERNARWPRRTLPLVSHVEYAPRAL